MESNHQATPVAPVKLPVIDISPLTGGKPGDKPVDEAALQKVVDELREACLRFGFFYIKNHGIDENLISQLFAEGKRFFAECPQGKKESIHMRNNAVFRGWFELQGEYTSKKKDFKVRRCRRHTTRTRTHTARTSSNTRVLCACVQEGLYFGAELGEDAEEVKAKVRS
jgi:isopenicillin N synthase-like dioxygenase